MKIIDIRILYCFLMNLGFDVFLFLLLLLLENARFQYRQEAVAITH